MRFSVHCSLFNVFCCINILCLTKGNESVENSGDLPFYGIAESSSRFLFVSTLDGKLTALNPNSDGSVVWSIHPGSESMLSSSIHKLELSNYGHMVRMIPSLSGGLYKFNGENIEVIPVNADNLLQSSFRYSDDLVISGGKETQTFGVSVKSGHIIYECSMKKCGNVTHSADGNEIILIQRFSQIVRAVEPRTGSEKWNFSVAQHDLKLLSEGHFTSSGEVNYKLRVVVPEGILYAVDSVNPASTLWKHKFTSPIVGVWQLQKGKLIKVDIFNAYQSVNVEPEITPSIYIGMYNKQLYIQESILMLRKRQELTSKIKHKFIGHEKDYLKIPWKPYSASNTALEMIYPESVESLNSLDDPNQRKITALSVLYASSYVDGSGFYLYSEEEYEKNKNIYCNASSDKVVLEGNEESSYLNSDSSFINTYDNEKANPNTTAEIVIVSFWYYWKEIMVISATTAFLCHLMVTRTYLRWKIKGLSKTSLDTKSPIYVKESDISQDQPSNILKVGSSDNYSSRYLSDFEPVACLGKGGFGVVFEARNKIDDCHYAIKRILLPNKIESRERVMREVKALAKLDHHHIVRYFNAWTECPPPGWQEYYDKSWNNMDNDILTSNEVCSVEASSADLESSCKTSSSLNVSSFEPCLNSARNLKRELDNIKDNINNDISDSFVVFRDSFRAQEFDEKKFQSKKGSTATFSSKSEKLVTRSKAKKSPKSSKKSLKLSLNFGSESQNSSKIYLYIQMQLCQRESLRDWLILNVERDYDNVLHIFEQILQAVEHVHLHGLIHRDLKPSNIFFSLNNQIKVGDFGLVTAMTEGDVHMTPMGSPVKINEKHTAQVGTQLYMSQEQLLGKAYNYKVDIYSLGLILFELLVPFSTQMERISVLQNIKSDRYPDSFKNKYKKEYELLRLMLSHCPDERPTTYGIRARLPLKQELVEDTWHFDLPMRNKIYSKICHTINEANSDTL